jgi:protein MpaA
MAILLAGLLASAAFLAATTPAPHADAAPAADSPVVAQSTHRPSTFSIRLARLEHAPLQGNSWAHGSVTIGHSLRERSINLREWGSDEDGRRILVFGCIHGTECAASDLPGFVYSCPTPGAVFYVPNLNPDGLALGTRVNGRGVDLNRNFPASWAPIGGPWDLQYSGPGPFSETETRLAARLIRAIRPDVTIWFHQEAEPMVRAWGPSMPAARRFARSLKRVRYTNLPFRRLPWLAGTAPNWQNHRFPGTASFVVELPPGSLPRSDAGTIAAAVARLAGYPPRDL